MDKSQQYSFRFFWLNIASPLYKNRLQKTVAKRYCSERSNTHSNKLARLATGLLKARIFPDIPILYIGRIEKKPT